MAYTVQFSGAAAPPSKRKVKTWLEVRATVAEITEMILIALPPGKREQAYATDVLQLNAKTVGDPAPFTYEFATVDVSVKVSES